MSAPAFAAPVRVSVRELDLVDAHHGRIVVVGKSDGEGAVVAALVDDGRVPALVVPLRAPPGPRAGGDAGPAPRGRRRVGAPAGAAAAASCTRARS